MWSNGDVSGVKSGRLSAMFSLCLAVLALWPWWEGRANIVWAISGFLLGFWMMILALRFKKIGARPAARKLFLFTLLYLPIALTILALCWKRG